MHPALWISQTGLEAQTKDLAVISNNLANAGTVGFKKSRVAFEDLFYQNLRQPGAQSSADSRLPSGLQLGTGVKVVATQKIHTQGSFQTSENQLDMAIQGAGFFQVLLPDGSTAYTRAGNFGLDENGQIVTQGNGYVLQPGFTIPQTSTSLDVATDGTISVQEQGVAAPTVVGNLQLADFVNPSGLQPIGENLFIETGSSGAPVVGTPGLDGLGAVRGGQLETSNVSTVEELVAMIETQRTYETNAKVLSAVDQMLQFINQTL
ncbi:flagellar basal-body rod protein FlgG [Aliikangiella coralliicola]|uniref:Flagellar basal-body rod protein FlgG n=1 Tax=Aliikangiella coralliicola TaxID=2592383 RepID=A0A545U5X4_9GAMM|nr:flagellar basal-body rod protein FlgG [Aliikangiella coralliicola]TQV84868.1 flagellar basal-body rod protein FlgG [Aliikangiella coralliicola]